MRREEIFEFWRETAKIFASPKRSLKRSCSDIMDQAIKIIEKYEKEMENMEKELESIKTVQKEAKVVEVR